MKRTIAIFLTIILMLSLSACGENKIGETPSDEAEPAGASLESKTEKQIVGEEPVVDEGLFDVEVTLPASLFEDVTEDDIVANAKECGFSDCVIHEDGTVTYKMTKAKYREMLDEMKVSIDDSISELLNGENAVESFKKIEYSDDFSKFDVYVESTKYSAFDGLYVLTFFISGAYYQMFAGVSEDDIDIAVNFIDCVSNELLDSSSYKEWVESMNE